MASLCCSMSAWISSTLMRTAARVVDARAFHSARVLEARAWIAGPSLGPPGPRVVLEALRPALKSVRMRTDFRAGLNASSTTRGPGGPKLGPAIHALASSTRAEWKALASTTRAAVRIKVEEIHALIEQHKEAMKQHAQDAKDKAK